MQVAFLSGLSATKMVCWSSLAIAVPEMVYKRVRENWSPVWLWQTRALWLNTPRSFSLGIQILPLLWKSGSQTLWAGWNFSKRMQTASSWAPAQGFLQPQQHPGHRLAHWITCFCDRGHRICLDYSRNCRTKYTPHWLLYSDILKLSVPRATSNPTDVVIVL